MPAPMIVVGRLAEECPGGTQYHYRVRGTSAEVFDVLDVELVGLSEVDMSKWKPNVDWGDVAKMFKRTEGQP